MSGDPFDNDEERTTVSPMSRPPGAAPPVPGKGGGKKTGKNGSFLHIYVDMNVWKIFFLLCLGFVFFFR